MKMLTWFVAWCILLVLCWPIALAALVLAPFIFLLTLPFRIVGVVLHALLAFVRAILFLPARLLR